MNFDLMLRVKGLYTKLTSAAGGLQGMVGMQA